MPIMNDGGAVGNVSSASALCPFGGVSSYTASKSALNSFSQSLSCERGRISVSSVMPGFVRTDIMKNQELSEKEENAVRLFSAKAEKTAGRILSRLRKRKRRIVLGLDGHFMSVMYRLFPSLTPRLITRVLRASGMNLFKKI